MYIKEIEKIVSKDKFYENELMSNYTSFKIGGPAECLIKIQTAEELKLSFKARIKAFTYDFLKSVISIVLILFRVSSISS